MRTAYDKETAAPVPPEAQMQSYSSDAPPADADGEEVQQSAPRTPTQPPRKPAPGKPRAAPAPQPKTVRPAAAELQVLNSLRDQGILTEEEFEAARKRLAAAR
jgi:hypothetical protein